MRKLTLYPETRFGGFSRRDGNVAFYTRVNSMLDLSMRVLDYGCGAGSHYASEDPFTRSLQSLRGKVSHVIGADVAEHPPENPTIDRYVRIGENGLPLDSESVDLCVCDWTLEHLEDVPSCLREIHRVLVPGGYLCIRTPNAFHYSSIGARVLPFRYHLAVRRFLNQFHDEADVFPTYYRCNTKGRLTRTLRATGFDGVVIAHRGESHLRLANPALAWIGEVIEIAAPRLFWHELHAYASRS